MSVAEPPESGQVEGPKKRTWADFLDLVEASPVFTLDETAAAKKATATADSPADPQAQSDNAAELMEAKDLDPSTEASGYLVYGVKHGFHTLRYWRGVWMFWSNGRYFPVSPSEIRCRIINHLDCQFRMLNKSIVNNVIDVLMAKAMLADSVESPSWIDGLRCEWAPTDVLATKSELIHLPSYAGGREHYSRFATPAFFTFAATDFEFEQGAEAPEWESFLNALFPDDKASIDLIQEWFGYQLTADTSQQKILLMVGPKRAGKGTILRVLKGLIGEQKICAPTLSSLTTQFGLWPLLGKTAAIISDARLGPKNDHAAVAERLLSISGEDVQTVDRKGIEPVTTKLLTRFTISTNELPRFSDPSGALAGRMLVLRFSESFFGREDPTLTSKLLGELPGILRWSIEGWQRLRERGHFVEPLSSKGMARSLDDLSSPISAFLRDHCIVDKEKMVQVNDLFSTWGTWCERNGHNPGTSQLLGRNLYAVIPTISTVRPRAGNSARLRYYKGLRYRKVDEANEATDTADDDAEWDKIESALS